MRKKREIRKGKNERDEMKRCRGKADEGDIGRKRKGRENNVVNFLQITFI